MCAATPARAEERPPPWSRWWGRSSERGPALRSSPSPPTPRATGGDACKAWRARGPHSFHSMAKQLFDLPGRVHDQQLLEAKEAGTAAVFAALHARRDHPPHRRGAGHVPSLLLGGGDAGVAAPFHASARPRGGRAPADSHLQPLRPEALHLLLPERPRALVRQRVRGGS